MDEDEGRDSLSIDRHRGRRSQSSSIAGERKKSHLFEKVMDTAFWLRDVPEKALLEGEMCLKRLFSKGRGVGKKSCYTIAAYKTKRNRYIN